MFDSVEEEEWEETVNKLGANVRTIERAERAMQAEAEEGVETNGMGKSARVDLAG